MRRNAELPSLFHSFVAEDSIIHDSEFASGVVKILCGAEQSMSPGEQAQCLSLQVAESHSNYLPEPAAMEHGSLESYMQAYKKHRASKGERRAGRYFNCGWIPCAVTEAKRLFSNCRSVWFDSQLAYGTGFLSVTTYLKANRDYWDIDTFGRAVRQLTGDHPAAKAFMAADDENEPLNVDADD